ncbi:MAG: D-alanyl-D-alanine carboxypeptidase family protein [Acutalibacteraceae bacterium]
MKKLICFCLTLFLLSNMPVCAVSTCAKAAAVINGDTGEIIYAQNADERLPMASTTKIMTALLLCENADLNEEITVTADMLKVEGSSMGLLAGDRVSYHDLLYGMMLASGNDAANVTAISLGGSVPKFAEMMNKKAEELGLKDTHFVTPSGLDADGHYTTAKDLALLAAYALENETFAEAAASKSAVLNYGNPPYRRSLTNHNKMLKLFEGAVGVKTGFTKKSGRCLVSAARRDGKLAVAVTLNDPDDWNDHTNLLEFGLDSIKQTEYSPKISCYNIPVIGSAEEQIEVFIEPYTVNTLETENISCSVNLPKFVYAPIAKGDILGSAEYKMGDEVIGRVELTALRNISAFSEKPSLAKELKKNIKYILMSI